MPPPRGQNADDKLVVEEKHAHREHEVVEECVVGAEDDSNLPGRNDEEADDAPTAREKQHPDENDLKRQCAGNGGRMKPVREML